jgi:hypothetical protein
MRYFSGTHLPRKSRSDCNGISIKSVSEDNAKVVRQLLFVEEVLFVFVMLLGLFKATLSVVVLYSIEW